MFHRRGRGWPGSRGFLGGHGLSRMCVEVVPGRGTPSDERAARTEGGGCPRTMVWLNWVGDVAARGLRGLVGLRDEAPSGRLPTDNGLAQLGRLWCLWAARGLRGLVAVPVGGGRAWPGFEIDHSERSSCVAISRAGRRPQAQPAGSSGQASCRPEVRWRRCRVEAWWWRCRAGAR